MADAVASYYFAKHFDGESSNLGKASAEENGDADAPPIKRKKLKTPKWEERKSQPITSSESSKSLKNDDESEQPDESNLTALEKQFIKLKEENPGVVLLIETGYLFRLFREDAEVANRDLRFKLSAGHNLITTSFPLQTLPIHIRHLAAKGHKVGVVRKIESNLMKANGAEPNDIFKREVAAIYTNSTLIGEDVDLSFCSSDNSTYKNHLNDSSYLMSLYELPSAAQKVRIGIIAVCLLSGDFVYDHFVDDENRYQFQSCFQSINPVEILVPRFAISDITLNFINAKKEMSGRNNQNTQIRIELMNDDDYKLGNIDEFLREFFLNMQCHKYAESADELVHFIMNLPSPVICCLRAIITYLGRFKLQYIFTLITQMRSRSSKMDSVVLDTNTIRSLELLQCNGSDSYEGSLLHILDHTNTPYGFRLLKNWICNPLKCISHINERLEAVHFLVNIDLDFIKHFKKMLSTFPDLENGIILIYNKRSSPKLYFRTVEAFISIRNFIMSFEREICCQITNSYLKQLFVGIINLTEEVENLIFNLNTEAVNLGSKIDLFNDSSSFPALFSIIEEIERVKQMLANCLPEIAKQINDREVTFGSFYDKKYVILLPITSEHLIPSEWLIVARNSSKICCRTSETETYVRKLKLLEEHLKYHCQLAWIEYLNNFKSYYFKLRNVIINLSTIDCLLSLATVSKCQNFLRPIICDDVDNEIIIKNGHHPIVNQALEIGKEFVPNNTTLSKKGESCLLISGANMGGKSVYIRQVAIIVIMSQIGCFVPAEYASLTPVDAIYLRCGVKDDIMKGKSAFYVEVEEISNVLHLATSNSLILIDEFGKCTSDSDGINLTYGIINYLITKLQCLTLVVTSQFSDLLKLQDIYPNKVACYHMTVIAPSIEDVSDKPIENHGITYLYKLHRGIADKSYAIYVGKMAGIETRILNASFKKSMETENYRNNLRCVRYCTKKRSSRL